MAWPRPCIGLQNTFCLPCSSREVSVILLDACIMYGRKWHPLHPLINSWDQLSWEKSSILATSHLKLCALHQSRISWDALINLHEVAYDIPGFVWKINTYPDLVCVCGLQEVVQDVDRVLMLDSSSQLLSYDTTFQLGDFYVSPLIVRHTLFREKPCIPAMFLIHERKLTGLTKRCSKSASSAFLLWRKQSARLWPIGRKLSWMPSPARFHH